MDRITLTTYFFRQLYLNGNLPYRYYVRVGKNTIEVSKAKAKLLVKDTTEIEIEPNPADTIGVIILNTK